MDTKQYLSFAEYKGLGGTLERTSFALAEFEARKKIDSMTSNRLTNLLIQNEEVKMCMCLLIKEKIKDESQAGKTSESVGNYSVTYSQKNAEDVKKLDEKYNSIIKECLNDCFLEDGTPYLYCGVGCSNVY